MRLFCAKFLIFSSLIFGAPIAHANIYRIDLNYTDRNTPTTGTLSGYIVIDSTQFDGTENRNTGNSISLPAWISQASLTLTPTGGGSDITQTNFERLDWNVNVADFDPTGNFLTQVTRFGLNDFNDFKGSSSSFPLDQGYDAGEFLLSSAGTPQAAPGPLPILGLGTFFWYFKKLRKKKV